MPIAVHEADVKTDRGGRALEARRVARDDKIGGYVIGIAAAPSPCPKIGIPVDLHGKQMTRDAVMRLVARGSSRTGTSSPRQVLGTAHRIANLLSWRNGLVSLG
jgi:hypothetical protein